MSIRYHNLIEATMDMPEADLERMKKKHPNAVRHVKEERERRGIPPRKNNAPKGD